MPDGPPANPKLNDVWIDAGKLKYYDGQAWVPYLSPPDALEDQTPGGGGYLEEQEPDQKQVTNDAAERTA